MSEAVKAVLKAYFTTELLRSRGIVFGVLSTILWIILFTAPIILFSPPNINPGIVTAFAFTAVLVFLSYSTATWDWAWELRWLLTKGILEYVIASGRSIFVLYAGVLPISFMWMALSLALVYTVLSIMIAPPALAVHSAPVLALGIALFIIVLFSHALVLGGTTIAVGTSGPVMEVISWVLPIATGGLVPLRNMPHVIQVVALCTPYSYPAELIRYAIIGVDPVLPLDHAILYGVLSAVAYLALSLLYFRMQYRKLLREGPKTVGMY